MGKCNREYVRFEFGLTDFLTIRKGQDHALSIAFGPDSRVSEKACNEQAMAPRLLSDA